MKKNFLAAATFLLLSVSGLNAQNKLSIDKVYSATLKNSGTIIESNQIKGYFFLYQSDKIDKHTMEYKVQILDQILNRVEEIVFEDSKKISLLEASYNQSTMAFLFKNEETKKLEMKIYGVHGKLKNQYTNEFSVKTSDAMNLYKAFDNDESTNQMVLI